MGQNEIIPLTSKQEKFVVAMSVYPSIENARKAAGVGKATAYRWRKIPEVTAAIEAERHRLLADLRDHFRLAAVVCVARLKRIVEDDQNLDNVIRAAAVILKPFGQQSVNVLNQQTNEYKNKSIQIVVWKDPDVREREKREFIDAAASKPVENDTIS